MEESPNTIVKSRKELMISPTNANPILRTAHFLNPSLSFNHKGISELSSPSLPSLPSSFDPQNWPLTVNFNGWKNPPKKWKEWVDKMASLHAPTWKKAGIHEAIFNSTYEIRKNSDLVLGVAERWCPDTKSFIFPWGEATVTLEDMMIDGYSVLGSPIFEPLETEELKAIEEVLLRERRKTNQTPAKKALQSTWLKIFMDSGSEIEHEAFLSLWLSRFVFPTSHDVICQCVFPVAIHLARGTRVALAPAILATIYRDLTLLKEKIVSLTALDADSEKENLAVTIWSPFQLVLVWAWERFVKLSPPPNLIKNGESRFAQWNNTKRNIENVRLVLDSSKESFNWRPYTKALKNWDIPKFYGEKEIWVSSNSDLDEDLLSFILCLRVSELVGLELKCREQYLPHRVARQFGFDQDVPGVVAHSSVSPEDAWSFYIRPVDDVKWFIPSRLFETDVTTRYLDWCKSLEFRKQEKSSKAVTNVLKEKKKGKKKAAGSLNRTKGAYGDNITPGISLHSPRSQPQNLLTSSRIKTEKMTETNNLLVPPGFPPKFDSPTIAESLKSKEKQDVSRNRCTSFSGKADRSSSPIADNAARKNIWGEIQEEDNLTITEILKSKQNKDVASSSTQCGSRKNLSSAPNKSHSTPIASKTSAVAAPVKLKIDDDCNLVPSQSRSHSCSATGNAFPRGFDQVASVEAGKNEKNFHVQLSQSQSHSSSVAGNDTPKDSELQVTLAENVMENEAEGSKQDVGSPNDPHRINGNGKRSSDSWDEAISLALEDKIQSLEKKFSERKAWLESKKLRR